MTRKHDRFQPLADQEPDDQPATWDELMLVVAVGAALATLTTAILVAGIFIGAQVIGLIEALIF